MNQRHSENKNLILHNAGTFEGYQVNMNHGPLIQGYLSKSISTLNKSLQSHPRTLVLGFILRVPTGLTIVRPNAISCFFDSIKAQISHDRKQALLRNQRVHLTDVRYVWAKERDGSVFDHYHVFLLLNADAYHTLGSYSADEGNMSARIVKAWASALQLYPECVRTSVQFASPQICHAENLEEKQAIVYWMSYLAKAATKNYGDSGRSFGCSLR